MDLNQAFRYLKKYGHEIGNKAYNGDMLCKHIKELFSLYLRDIENEQKKQDFINAIEQYKKTIR